MTADSFMRPNFGFGVNVFIALGNTRSINALWLLKNHSRVPITTKSEAIEIFGQSNISNMDIVITLLINAVSWHLRRFCKIVTRGPRQSNTISHLWQYTRNRVLTQIIRQARTCHVETWCTLSSFTRVPIYARGFCKTADEHISFALKRLQINERPDCSTPPFSLSLTLSLSLRRRIFLLPLLTPSLQFAPTIVRYCDASHAAYRIVCIARYADAPQDVPQTRISVCVRKKGEEEKLIKDILSYLEKGDRFFSPLAKASRGAWFLND